MSVKHPSESAGQPSGERGQPSGESGDTAAARKRERERQRRLAEVFGDVLPDTTSDDRSEGWDERESGGEDWLRSQVPPHHG